MQHQNGTSSSASAPSAVRDNAKRERVKQLAREAAWPEQVDCPTCTACTTCGGDGRVDGPLIIHSRSPHGFGADWHLDSLLAAIDKAEYVAWTDSIGGHDLVVEVQGKPYRFQVKRPQQEGVA